MAKTRLRVPASMLSLDLSSPVNILQIADVALRVVFLLFLLCF